MPLLYTLFIFFFLPSSRTPSTLYTLWRSSSGRAKRWACTSARVTALIDPTASSSPASPSRAPSTIPDVSGYHYLHVFYSYVLRKRHILSFWCLLATTPAHPVAVPVPCPIFFPSFSISGKENLYIFPWLSFSSFIARSILDLQPRYSARPLSFSLHMYRD